MKKVDVAVEFILKNTGKLLAAGILFFIITGLGLLQLETDFSFRVWFKKDDPGIVYYNHFEKTFGNEDKIILLVKSPDELFTNENINLINKITRDFQLLPQVTHVDSLTTFDLIESHDDEINVGPLFDFETLPEIELTDKELEEVRKKAVNHKVMRDFIINKDGKTTSIFGTLKPVFEGNPNYKNTFTELEKLQRGLQAKYPKVEFHITGSATSIEYYRKEVTRDMSVIFPVIITSVTLIMLLLFRSFYVVAMTFVVIAATIVSTLGLGALLGVKINPLTSMIPCILIAICLADSIHIMATYAKFNNGDGNVLKRTLVKNFFPTLFTSLTTAIGFSSFILTKIAPISELGLMVSIGTFLAWIYTYAFLPHFLSRKGAQVKARSIISTIRVDRYLSFLKENKKVIFFSFLGIFILGIATLKDVDIDNNATKMFKASHPMVKALDFASDNLGVAKEINIVLYKKDLGNLYGSKALLKLETLQRRLEKLPFVTKTQSLVNIVQETNQALLGSEHFTIPDSNKRIAENIFLYELSSSAQNNLYRFISRDGEMMRMNVIWMTNGSKQVTRNLEIIKSEMDKLGVKGHITGKVPLLTDQNVEVINTFVESLMLSLFFITLFIMWHLKSIKLGLIALIPNILPLAIISIMMAKLGISLNAGTVLVASISLGIAVDDTIHFFDHFKNRFSETVDVEASLKDVFETTGSALVTTTLVLVTCFASFFAGNLQLNSDFGMLTSACLIFALVADLAVVPSLFLLLKFQSFQKVPRTFLRVPA